MKICQITGVLGQPVQGIFWHNYLKKYLFTFSGDALKAARTKH